MRTFGDQVRQLTDTFTTALPVDRIGRQVRNAVRAAYRDIASRLQWNYLVRQEQLNTVAPYSTGTIEYESDTRTVTLTDGTFPSWSTSGELLVSRNVYAIERRVSGTTLILVDGRCPTGDLAADTAYTLVKTRYNLPSNFVELRAIIELGRLWRVAFLPPEEMLTRTQVWFDPSDILFYTILGSGNGRMTLQFGPPPVAARTYDIIYQASPRPLGLKRAYDTGTIATTAGNSTVTFTGSSLPTNCVGCVLRIGTASTQPEGESGDNPAAEEHTILARSSATELILTDNAVNTGSGLRFSIDDPIDLEPVSMLTLFDRMCESRMLRIHQSDMNRISVAEAAELQALRMAMQADSRLLPKIMSGGVLPSLGDMLFGVTPRAS